MTKLVSCTVSIILVNHKVAITNCTVLNAHAYGQTTKKIEEDNHLNLWLIFCRIFRKNSWKNMG